MSADDVAMALIAMEEQDVRQKVRDGDLEALGSLKLSAKEEKLVRDAAEEEADPDVEGFEFGSSATFGAVQYSVGNIYDPGVQKSFSSMVASRYGNIGGAVAGPCACPPMGSKLGGGVISQY